MQYLLPKLKIAHKDRQMKMSAHNYHHMPLEHFISHKAWKSLCQKLKKTPLHLFSEFEYEGEEGVISYYQHSEYLAKAAACLAANTGSDMAKIYVMAYVSNLEMPSIQSQLQANTPQQNRLTIAQKVWQEEIIDPIGEEAKPLYHIWLEYQQQSSAEAKLVWNLNKLGKVVEMILFLKRNPYLSKSKEEVVRSRFQKVMKQVRLPLLQQITQQLKEESIYKSFHMKQYHQWLKKCKV